MKKVIYSAIVGSYDNIIQPKAVSPDYDYILFNNDISESQIGVWKIRKIPYNNKDNTRIARWVKTHPHILLPEYDFSVWVDSNVVIVSDKVYEIFNELNEKGSLISSFAHPQRDCIYDECLQVALKDKDSFKRMLPQMTYLKEVGYPRHQGLFETNCVYRAHQKKVSQLNEEWWKMINRFSKRDQLSFNYVLWNNKIECDYLLDKEYNSRNHPYFKCIKHTNVPHDKWVWNHKMKAIPIRLYPFLYDQIIKAKANSKSEKMWTSLLLLSDDFFHFCNKIASKYVFK